MAKVTLYVRACQDTGVINLRFRLRDGRTTQFFHPSNIEADVNDLKKLTNEGKPKPGVRVYNKDLVGKIEAESKLLLDAYNGILEDDLVPNIDLIEERIIAIKNPVKKVRQCFVSSTQVQVVAGAGLLLHYSYFFLNRICGILRFVFCMVKVKNQNI